MRIVVFATVLLASSSLAPHSPKSRAHQLRSRKQFLPSRTRVPSNREINGPIATNRGPMIVRWVAIGGCVAATATVWVAKIAKWVPNGECVATAMMIAITRKIAEDTETGAIGTIENGTARSESTTTEVTTMKIGPDVA